MLWKFNKEMGVPERFFLFTREGMFKKCHSIAITARDSSPREAKKETSMKRRFCCLLSFSLILFYGNICTLYGAEQEGMAALGSEFYLGPGDVLEMSVWKDEALSRQVVVRPDGKISFPLIGDVVARGRTVEELRQVVEGKIKVYVPDAPVTVMVVQVGSPKVYVVGKVGKPGLYIMGQTLRVMQVLAMAGGMTPFAKKDDILIIRKENGHQKVFKFNYGKVADGKDLDQNICLEAGDTVVVP
jgi:polysaccharide export outer membrane protein